MKIKYIVLKEGYDWLSIGNEDNQITTSEYRDLCLYLKKNISDKSIVYDYNKASKDFLTHAGFAEEGRLKEHRYYGGRYYDMLTLALYRDMFYHKMKNMIENIKKSN